MNFNKFYFLKKTTFLLFFLFILSCESNIPSDMSNPKTKESIQPQQSALSSPIPMVSSTTSPTPTPQKTLDPQAKKQEIYKEFERRKNEVRQKMEPALTEYLSIGKEITIQLNLLRNSQEFREKINYIDSLRKKQEEKKPAFLKRVLGEEYLLNLRDFDQGKISLDELNKIKLEYYVNSYVYRDILYAPDDTNVDTKRIKLYNDFVELYMIMYP